jgi:hypothetical protein
VKVYLEQGGVYTGKFIGGLRNDKDGRLLFENGMLEYQGGFKDDMKWGTGSITSTDKAIIVDKNGNRLDFFFEGEFEFDKRQGKGQLIV